MATPKTIPNTGIKTRPPIVAVMGHVDHGKTTLLDHIRKANVAAKEAGGITQSIGAYEIEHGGKKITFIDTPGHEAFISMRTRGASAADLAVLVVAADEGVKPQTLESIRILEQTKTPFVVAITKIDKNNADVERIKNDLTSSGVLLEGYGGKVSYEPVSAKTGENVEKLLDLLLLAAEIENLTYDPIAPASGFILETKVDPRRGLEASLIVKNGTLKQGEPIGTPTARGKVKILEDWSGQTVKTLIPSAPALIIGFEKLPLVGEEFITGEGALKQAAETKKQPEAAALDGGAETLNLILKASDAGSLEALSQIIGGMASGSSPKPIKIVGQSVGEVLDGDVQLAISSKAYVIAFKSKANKAAKTIAEVNGVRIISSEIIYELVNSIEEFLKELSKPAAPGTLEILAVFSQPKNDKQVVGGKVVQGLFKNKAPFGVEREGNVVGSGRVMNLQRNKKDAPEVPEGNEAGLMVSATTMLQAGDKLVIKG